MGTLMNQVADTFQEGQTFDDYSVVVRTEESCYKIWYNRELDIYQCDCNEIEDESLETIVNSLEILIDRKGEAILSVSLE